MSHFMVVAYKRRAHEEIINILVSFSSVNIKFQAENEFPPTSFFTYMEEFASLQGIHCTTCDFLICEEIPTKDEIAEVSFFEIDKVLFRNNTVSSMHRSAS